MEVVPREIVQLICTFLDVPHVVSFSSCSRFLLTAINSDSLWERLRPNRRQVIIENLKNLPEGKYDIKFNLNVDFIPDTVYPYRPHLKSLVNVRNAEVYRTTPFGTIVAIWGNSWCYSFNHCRVWTLAKKFCIPMSQFGISERNTLEEKHGIKIIANLDFVFENTFVHVEGEDFSVVELLTVPKTQSHISLEQLKAWENIIDRKLKLIHHGSKSPETVHTAKRQKT